MLRSNSVRTLLIIVLVAGLGAIAWSYLSRRNQYGQNQLGHLLSSKISRLSKEFEYSQLKGGEELFRVRAGTNTLMKEAVQILEDVDMVRFDESGEATDAVESKNAIYRIEEKEIEFEDDVRIHLTGGTKITADQAWADLDAEHITIDGAFEFEQGTIRGNGNALTYSIPEKMIEIGGGSRVDFRLGNDEGSANSDTVIYSSNVEEVILRGNSNIRTSSYQLSAEQIEVLLDANREVSGIRSVGNARLQTGGKRKFTGAVINIGLDPETGQPTGFEVLSGKSGILETPQLAVFSETSGEGLHRLESSRIDGEMAEVSSGKGFVLSRITATDKVMLRSSRLGIESCRAALFSASFADSYEGFEAISLSGDVRLVRRPILDQPSHQEILRSENLNIFLDSEQRLQRIEAMVEVEIEFSREDIYRHLYAQDSAELTYKNGWLHRATASEDCILMSIHGQGRDTVRAPSLNAEFSEGGVREVLAVGGVDLEFIEGAENVRHSRSEQLQLIYSDGRVAEARQWGSFHFWDRTSATATELVSDQAVYDPAAGVVTASGDSDSVLRSFDSNPAAVSNGHSETYAKEFVLNQKANRIVARKEVESVVRQDGEPLILTADKMEIDLDSGWICYSDSPRLIQGPNLITGEKICINNNQKRLNVEKNVKSLLVEMEESGGQKYEIKADQMSYKKIHCKVTYTNEVEVKTEGLSLAAPRVEFIFTAQDLGELERIEASGGVTIVEKGRTWRGRKAVYYRANERVVVRNDG